MPWLRTRYDADLPAARAAKMARNLLRVIALVAIGWYRDQDLRWCAIVRPVRDLGLSPGLFDTHARLS